MKRLLFLACIIIAGISASAQISPLLEKGKSGFGIKGTFEKSSPYYAYGGRIGGSVLGKLDIEFCYQNHYWDKENSSLLSDDATNAYYEGRLTWWPVRKEVATNIDVNLGVIAGFDYGPYDNFTYPGDVAGTITTYDHFIDAQFGLSSSLNFKIADSWYFLPSFSIIYEVGQQQETTDGVERTWADNGVTGKTGITIMKKFKKGCAIYLDAEEYSDTFGKYPFYQCSLGFVMPF